MPVVPQELREVIGKIDYRPDEDGHASADALKARVLLTLVDAIEKQTAALERLAEAEEIRNRFKGLG